MTIGQFIAECYTFPYSKEYYEMLQAEYKMNLCSTYVESINYRNSKIYNAFEESGWLPDSDYFLPNRSIYMEDGENKPGVVGVFFKKVGRMIVRVWRFFCRCLDSVIYWISKLFTGENSEKDWLRKRRRMEEDIKDFSPINADNARKLMDRIKKDASQETQNLLDKITVADPGSMKEIKFAAGVDNDTRRRIFNYCALMCSTDARIIIKDGGLSKFATTQQGGTRSEVELDVPKGAKVAEGDADEGMSHKIAPVSVILNAVRGVASGLERISSGSKKASEARKLVTDQFSKVKKAKEDGVDPSTIEVGTFISSFQKDAEEFKIARQEIDEKLNSLDSYINELTEDGGAKKSQITDIVKLFVQEIGNAGNYQALCMRVLRSMVETKNKDLLAGINKDHEEWT